MTGLEISRQFINDLLLPLMQAELGERCDRLAVAIIGTGSDVLGLDDPISRDHHWGPRANILYTRQDAEELAPPVGKLLRDDLPAHYDGHPLRVDIGNLTGVCHSDVESFFERFLATTKLPQRDEDWLGLCEVDLFHVTSGEVVFDGLGEMTARREALSYYPDAIWKKRIADWCMYVSGRESPYNLHRVGKREDDLTCTIYLGQCLKRQMELCFMLNRQYAPYTKWLNVCFRRLPEVADQLAPIIDAVMAERDWAQRVRLLIDGNYVLADAIAALGLTAPVERREFDEGLTDLTLYDSAAQIYGKLPRSLRDPSFNQIEHWEKMARDVLFDTNDYLGGAGKAHDG
ncbi:MAG: DUF4037 domain-containing protein [Planctomycetota bacterium]